MKENVHFTLSFIFMVPILSCCIYVTAMPNCRNCGRIPVPYPLSTDPNCGDQSYKIRCTANTLWFDALHGSSYMITSINPLTRRMIIRPSTLASKTCVSSDIAAEGIQLDNKLPFTITDANSILLLNCTDAVLRLQAVGPGAIDCKATSLCHRYVKDNAPECISAPLCCTLKGGGAQNAYAIRINRSGGCSAYQSFVYLKSNISVGAGAGAGAGAGSVGKKWGEPGLELEYRVPQEPVCVNPLGCKVLLNSKCLVDPLKVGQKRCYCDAGFKWDPNIGLCQSVQCQHGKRCKTGKKKKKKKTGLFAGMAVAVCGISFAVMIGILLYKKNKKVVTKEVSKNLIKEREEILNSRNNGKSSRIFTGKEITRATNNFSKTNLIGVGGFGEVFKAILDDGTITAIKRAKLGNTVGTDQILNEVRILCQVNHRSLVRLLGCCVDLELPLMIYEFIPNGTLFEHLHSNNSRIKSSLHWNRRLRIAHQTAEGLAYLHSAAVPPIYHRDVKSSNILLDDKLNAKVSDFGLSRVVEISENNDSHIFTCAQGTLGYLDPDYYRNFQLTDKSDVYSFGVVLFEILTSKKAIDFTREEEHVNLVVYMKKVMDEERLLEVVDPFLKENATKLEPETMKALGLLAVSCLDERRQNRPTMKEVADEIEYIISLGTGDAVSEA